MSALLISPFLIKSKYSRWYLAIIERSSLRWSAKPTNIYTEEHHILPRCLGGLDIPCNLTYLTAKEHFICHQLLAKAIIPKHVGKMLAGCRAMLMFSTIENRAIFRSRKYEATKHRLSQTILNYNKALSPEARADRYKHNKHASNIAAAKLAAMTDQERKVYYQNRSEKYKTTTRADGYIRKPQPIQKKTGLKTYYNPINHTQLDYFKPGTEPAGWISGDPRMRNKPRKEYITKGLSRPIEICRLRDKREMSLSSFYRWP